MAKRSDIKAGRAYIELFVKNNLLTRGLGVVKKQLQSLANGVQYVGAAFNQVGGLMTKVGIAGMAPFLAALKALPEAKQPLEDIKKALTEALGRPLLPLLYSVRELVMLFAHWAKNNKELVLSAFKLAAGFLAVGLALKVVGGLLLSAASALKIIAVTTGIIQGLFMFLLSPVGLLVVAMVAMAAAWLTFTGDGRRGIATLKQHLTEMRKDFHAIGDALLGGRIELAWEIVLTGMRVLTLKFINDFTQSFMSMLQGIVGAWAAAVNALGAPKAITKLLQDAKDILSVADTVPEMAIRALEMKIVELRKQAAAARALGFGGFSPMDEPKKVPILSNPNALTRGTAAVLGGKDDPVVKQLKRQEILDIRRNAFLAEMARRQGLRWRN